MDTFDETRARTRLAAAFRLADHFGFSEGICNHFSLAHPDGQRTLINPMGRHWSAMQPGDLVWVDDAGRPLDSSHSVEITAAMLHSAIHRTNRNARCVMHTHMPYATALTCIEGGEFRPIHQNGLRFHGAIGYDARYNGLIDDPAEADRIAQLLGDRQVLFMANHGVMVVGGGVAQAFDALYYLERACQLQVLAMSTGQPLREVPDAVARHTRRQYERGDSYAEPHFVALMRDVLGW